MSNLAEQSIDSAQQIVSIEHRGSISQRLMALGFLPGCLVRIVQTAPFGDPITVELDGWRVSVRRSEASLVRTAAPASS